MLVFCGVEEVGRVRQLREELESIPFFVVVPGEVGEESGEGFSVFTDGENKVKRAYRLAAETSVLFALDANLRALEGVALEEARAEEVGAVLCAAVPEVEPRTIDVQAPVLLVSDVLDGEICRSLVDVWERRGHEETGVEQSSAGRRQDQVDYGAKRRRDHVVDDAELMKVLSSTIGRRILPEVYKAFAYRATHFEGFKIACYAAEDSGFFQPHRDNLSPSTAHRRFALTINLNDGYKGGDLRFPEYGSHLYHPPPGAAVVFSCSHLHEVTPVQEGRRFALLSFLYAGEIQRPQSVL